MVSGVSGRACKAPCRAWRLSLAVCVGLALGVVACAIWPAPSVPDIRPLLGRIHVPALAEPGGPMPAKGAFVVEQKPVTMLFVGDIMLDREVAARMRRAGDSAYPFRLLPEGWIASFDLAVGNLEGPVTDRRRAPEKSIDFLFDPSVISTLHEQGFDAFSQANNHALDQGAIGYEDSLRRLREAGFLVFGHQVRDDEASACAETDIRGMRFGFCGFNTTDNALDKEAAASALSSMRTRVDWLIVMPHWGPEYRERPHPNEVALGRWFVEHGADAVIGGHPHWVQGISSHQGKPIAWSLGNFIFDQDWSDKTRQGLAVALTIAGEKIELEPIPVQIDRSQPRLLVGEERAKRLEELAAISDEDLRDQIRAGMIGF